MRVVLAEDSVLLREGLVRLLDEAGASVVAAVEDGTALVEAVVEHRPDVVDVRAPSRSTSRRSSRSSAFPRRVAITGA